MTEQRKPIGSAFPWIIARVVIPLMTAVALLSPLYESPLEDLAIFLAFLAYLAIMSDSLILEEADKEGIYYRRYFRKQFVPWNQTLGVIWTGWPKRQAWQPVVSLRLTRNCYRRTSGFSRGLPA